MSSVVVKEERRDDGGGRGGGEDEPLSFGTTATATATATARTKGREHFVHPVYWCLAATRHPVHRAIAASTASWPPGTKVCLEGSWVRKDAAALSPVLFVNRNVELTRPYKVI